MAQKLIDIDGLAFFKKQQDAFNDAKFMPYYDFIDDNGFIDTAKLPAATTEDITKIFEPDEDEAGNE